MTTKQPDWEAIERAYPSAHSMIRSAKRVFPALKTIARNGTTSAGAGKTNLFMTGPLTAPTDSGTSPWRRAPESRPPLSKSADNASLYEQNYEAAGFVRVDRQQRGDLIVMHVGRTVHPNHAGIYLGTDPSLPGEELGAFGPGPFLLHHLYGRPSEIIVYGGPWHDRTRLILRHKDAKQPT